MVDIVRICKNLDVCRCHLYTVQERSDISENGVVLDEREDLLVVFRRFFGDQRFGARVRREQARHELAHFVGVNFDARDVEIAQVDVQTAVCALVVALFVEIAIARIVRISLARVFARADKLIFSRRFVEVITAVRSLEIVIVSLRRIDVIFTVHVVALAVREQLERTADHVYAEHIVEIGVVAALGLNRDFEIDVACDVRDKFAQFGVAEFADNVHKQFDDREEVHIAVKRVRIAVGVLDDCRSHIVEKRGNLNVALYHELNLTIDVTAVVRDGLNDEKFVCRKSRNERLKHGAQINVVARLEACRDVDGFAYGEAIHVVEVGVFRKFVAVENVGARVGERNVEMLDFKRERQCHIVLGSVRNVRFVGNRARNVLVDDVACRDGVEFVAEFFGSVTRAVVDDFSHHKLSAFAEHSVSDVELIARNGFARSDRAEVLLVVRLHEVALLS